MLRKLIKYEWKGVYKMGLILLGVIAFATFLGFLASRSPLWADVVIYDDFAEGLATLMSFFAIMLYLMLLVGVVYAIMIYIGVRFYKTTYTDEGYLLHTLPVTKHQILVSKLLVSSLWLFIIYAAVFASGVLFTFFIMEAVNPGSVGEMMAYLPDVLGELGRAIRNMSGSDRIELIHFLISMILGMLVGIPSTILTIFCAISLGQLFSKHRVLMAILCYVGILITIAIFTAVVRSISYTGMFLYTLDQVLGYFFTLIDSTVVLNLFMGVGFYLLSYFITSRKLNME